MNERGTAEQTVVINQSLTRRTIYTQRSKLRRGWCTPSTTQKTIKHKDAAYVNFKRLHYSDNNQNISLSWHKSLHSFFLCPPACFWCRQCSLILRRTWRIGPIMVECPILGTVATSGHVLSSLFQLSDRHRLFLCPASTACVSSIVQLLFPVAFVFSCYCISP